MLTIDDCLPQVLPGLQGKISNTSEGQKQIALKMTGMENLAPEEGASTIVIYQSSDGSTRIDVRKRQPVGISDRFAPKATDR